MQTFRSIAVAVDFGGPSEHALRAASDMASKSGAELTLVHVVEPIVTPYPISMAPDAAIIQAAAKLELDAAAARAGDEVARARRVVLSGRPATEICAFVDENAVDLVVTGTHGRKALARWMLGSVAEKILRSSRVPVFIVHDAPRPFRRILATTDFGSSSSHAVELAAAVAAEHGARLTLLHVAEEIWPVYPISGGVAVPYPVVAAPPAAEIEAAARRRLDEASANLRTLAPRHEGVLRRGRAWAEIVGEAQEGDYDLVVVGTHGRMGPSRWLLGSVAEKVVRSARPPVLVVPAPQRE